MKESMKYELEVVRGDNVYTFSMPYGTPIGEIHDVLYEYIAKINESAQMALERARNTQEVKEEAACQ